MKNFDTILKIYSDLKNENVKGANEILSMALTRLAGAINKYSDVNIIEFIIASCKKIFEAQPSMSLLANSMALIISEAENLSKLKEDVSQIKSKIILKIEAIKRREKIAIQKICQNSNEIFYNKKNILTYSFSSTIFKVIDYQKQLNKNLNIYITESRPINEGILGAKEFSKLYPTKLFIDAAIGYIINEYDIDLILIGADSFTKNMVINKIGTLPLAIVAHELEIPIYVLCTSLKYYFGEEFGYTLKIEEKPYFEVSDIQKNNLEIKNFYFDKTPIKYITGIITETGKYDLKNDKLSFLKEFPIKTIKLLYKMI
ncbi:MAG: hypothetical protein ACTSYZ_00845 [Candidatus Helarchaeota archaeon]